MTTSGPLAFTFFPYLPLQRAAVIGSFRLVPASAFEGPWASKRFESLCKTFMEAFVGANRQTLSTGALLAHPTNGCDGFLSPAEERLALQRAVELGVLDSNPTWREGADSWNVVTSDNAAMHAWPIDLDSGAVTLTSGFVVEAMHGGLHITEDLVVPAPEELHVPMGALTLDDDVLSAAYRHFMPNTNAADDRAGRRVRDSVGWLSKAWRNTPSVDWPDRIVYLKTGFEALTGMSKTYEAAHALRDLFERVVGVQEAGTDLLWSPNETAIRTFVDESGKSRPCTDLEHWFRTFGRARNAVIHGDTSSGTLDYSEKGSAYNGPMFHMAERLLRESIKVTLADRGETLLYTSLPYRRIVASLQAEAED